MYPWERLSWEHAPCAHQRESSHHKSAHHKHARYMRANMRAPIIAAPTMSVHFNCLLVFEISLLLNARYERKFQLIASGSKKMQYFDYDWQIIVFFYSSVIFKQMTLTHTTPWICISSADYSRVYTHEGAWHESTRHVCARVRAPIIRASTISMPAIFAQIWERQS